MKRYSAAQARQQFSAVLDSAEKGEPVVVERRGVRFCIRTEPAKRSSRRLGPVIELLDPAVASGIWSWKWQSKGLRFSARKRPRR